MLKFLTRSLRSLGSRFWRFLGFFAILLLTRSGLKSIICILGTRPGDVLLHYTSGPDFSAYVQFLGHFRQFFDSSSVLIVNSYVLKL